MLGVFRGIGPKPTPEEIAKKKTKRFWWFREFFFCCPEKKNEEFIDIIQNSDGRASRNTIMSNASTLGIIAKTYVLHCTRNEISYEEFIL